MTVSIKQVFKIADLLAQFMAYISIGNAHTV